MFKDHANADGLLLPNDVTNIEAGGIVSVQHVASTCTPHHIVTTQEMNMSGSDTWVCSEVWRVARTSFFRPETILVKKNRANR